MYVPETVATVRMHGSDVIVHPATHAARGRKPERKTGEVHVSHLSGDITVREGFILR